MSEGDFHISLQQKILVEAKQTWILTCNAWVNLDSTSTLTNR